MSNCSLPFEEWSQHTLALCEHEPRKSISQPWRKFVNQLSPESPADFKFMADAAAHYTQFLSECRKSPHKTGCLP